MTSKSPFEINWPLTDPKLHNEPGSVSPDFFEKQIKANQAKPDLILKK